MVEKVVMSSYEERCELSFSKYSNLPKKDLDNEYIRLCDLLNELKNDNSIDTSNYISKVEENIRFVKKKLSYIKKNKTGSTFDKIIRWVLWSIVVVYCFSLLILPIWMIMSAFKTPLDYATNSFGFIKEFTFNNFANVFEKLKIQPDGKDVEYGIFEMLLFSLIYSFGVSALSVIFTTMMAYCLAKYKFPGNRLIYTIGIIVMIVPIIGSGPAAMLLKRQLGIYDNMLLLILTAPVGCFWGLNFLLLYGNFKQLPWDYAEAVFVDGGSHYSAFFKMYLPMALPTMMVIFILHFLASWNDYSSFLVWMPSTPNLAYGLYLFQGKSRALYKSAMTEIMAGFTMAIVPTVALYLASQKLILSKFTVGGLKG